MRVALSALVASLAISTAAFAEPVEGEWHVLGMTSVGTHSVLKSSVVLDRETWSAQFKVRLTLKDDIEVEEGVLVHDVIDHVVVLCRENMLIETGQVQYDKEGKKVGAHATAKVYRNPMVDGKIVTEVLRWACNRHPEKPKSKTLDV